MRPAYASLVRASFDKCLLAVSQVLVYPKPRVALLSTGNELRDISSSSNTSTGPQDEFAVFDANRPGLRAAVEGLGFEVVDLGIVGDE